MKIKYGTETIFTFKNFFIFVTLIGFFTNTLFFELIFGESDENDPNPQPPLGFNPETVTVGIMMLISLINFHKFSKAFKIGFILISTYTAYLVGESLIEYGKVMVYPHVFSRMLLGYTSFALYAVFKDVDPQKIKSIIYIILAAFVINTILYKTENLTIGAFMATERGFSSDAALLVAFCTLYFFSQYLDKGKIIDLSICFVLLAFVVFVQHRSVWVTTTIAITFILFLRMKSGNSGVNIGRLTTFIMIPIISVILLVSYLAVDKPEVLEKFQDRFNDIGAVTSEKKDDRSTGTWRYEQIMSYMPYIEENWLTGMRFKGFELPIQFYHPEAGTAYFDDNSGHHFHNFYIDKMFYFGIIGLIIVMYPILYLLSLAFKKKKYSTEQILLIGFTLCGIIFGMSYNWNLYFYVFIGIAIAFAEYQPVVDDTKNVDVTDFKNKFTKNLKTEAI